MTDAIEIAQSFEDVIKEECIDELSDNEAPSEPGDTKKDPFNDIVTQLCPNDCNGHGVCNEGGCLHSPHIYCCNDTVFVKMLEDT